MLDYTYRHSPHTIFNVWHDKLFTSRAKLAITTEWPHYWSSGAVKSTWVIHRSAIIRAILASEKFKLRVPRAFVEKMSIGDPLDPLLLQVLPHHLELEEHPEFVTDPLGEEAANQMAGVLHKYPVPFLLTLTGACAIHCRYCFRRHFPYQENLPKNDDWPHIKQYIEQNPLINEVILSGGDPNFVKSQISTLVGTSSISPSD